MKARLLVLGTVMALAVAACGGDESAAPISADDFDPSRFSDSTTIDNQWFPLRPGTQLVWEGTTEEDGEVIPHRLVSTVTDLKKTIGGVETIVLWERDFSGEELVEAEIAFFAQDEDGNVWRLGEYPEEYEEGEFVAAPAWLEGVKGARAGIAMPADPQLDAPDYSQGFAPEPVGFTDRARTREVGQTTCVPVDCYEDVLVIDEFNPDEPGKHQLKYYASEVGNVRVGWAGENESSKETLVLVERSELGTAELAQAREEALKLEQRAYEIKKGVFGGTSPSEQVSGTDG